MKDIKLGISSCLLGNEVRHDGGHKRDLYVMNVLSRYFSFRTFCPEMAIGLGVPRPTFRLVKKDDEVRLVGTKTPDVDLTQSMKKWSDRAVLDMTDLSGFILKSKSPSCGMERVRLYDESGMPSRDGVGITASIKVC